MCNRCAWSDQYGSYSISGISHSDPKDRSEQTTSLSDLVEYSRGLMTGLEKNPVSQMNPPLKAGKDSKKCPPSHRACFHRTREVPPAGSSLSPPPSLPLSLSPSLSLSTFPPPLPSLPRSHLDVTKEYCQHVWSTNCMPDIVLFPMCYSPDPDPSPRRWVLFPPKRK